MQIEGVNTIEPLLIEDLQANRSSITGSRHYGRPNTLSRGSTKTLEDRFLEFNIKFLKYFNLLEENTTSTIINTTINTKRHSRQRSSISSIRNSSPTKKTRFRSPSIISTTLNISSSNILPSSPPILDSSPNRTTLTSPIRELGFLDNLEEEEDTTKFSFLEDFEKEEEEEENNTTLLEVVERLESYNNNCLFCFIKRNSTYYLHSLTNCSNKNSKVLFKAIEQLENNINIRNLIGNNSLSKESYFPINFSNKYNLNNTNFKELILLGCFIARELEYKKLYSFKIFRGDSTTYTSLDNFTSLITSKDSNYIKALDLILELDLTYIDSILRERGI